MGFQVTKTLEERFNEKWTPEPFSGCWLWSGAISSHGYGRIFWKGYVYRASRISWFLKYGEMPPDHLDACHHCDTPLCVNPKHIFLGTASDNQIDAITKGRKKFKRGYGQDWAKTREWIARNPRKLCKRGHPLSGDNLYIDPRGYGNCVMCRRKPRKTVSP